MEPVKQVKVRLRDRQSGSELLWANPLQDGTFELDNSPWLIDGYSVHDVLSADPAGSRDYGPPHGRVPIYECTGIVRKGGWRTIRCKFPRELTTAQHKQLQKDLEPMHANAEGMDGVLYAVAVGPDGDVDAVGLWLHSKRGAHLQFADVYKTEMSS